MKMYGVCPATELHGSARTVGDKTDLETNDEGTRPLHHERKNNLMVLTATAAPDRNIVPVQYIKPLQQKWLWMRQS